MGLHDRGDAHKFANGLGVDFGLFHPFAQFCLFGDEFEEFHGVDLLAEAAKYLTRSQEVSLLGSMVVTGETSDHSL